MRDSRNWCGRRLGDKPLRYWIIRRSLFVILFLAQINKVEIKNKLYMGRPIAYLDQNVLDLFVKFGLFNSATSLRSHFQVVYSDETLKEIKRSGKQADKFLTVLSELNSLHLRVLVDSNFQITDRATLTERDPFDAYIEYCANEPVYEELQRAMEQWLLKLYGGRRGDGIGDIRREQEVAFNELLDYLQQSVEQVKDVFPGIDTTIQVLNTYTRDRFENTLNDLELQLKSNIENDREWSGIKDYRNAVGIGPLELNNIKPPNVIQKIWKLYKTVRPYRDLAITIDDFFGIARNPIHPEQLLHKHQKITLMYGLLNSLGYFPDSKVHKERRFLTALSDQEHASMASFTDHLFSRDANFVKKVEAVYEYLEIPTQVHFC